MDLFCYFCFVCTSTTVARSRCITEYIILIIMILHKMFIMEGLFMYKRKIKKLLVRYFSLDNDPNLNVLKKVAGSLFL